MTASENNIPAHRDPSADRTPRLRRKLLAQVALVLVGFLAGSLPSHAAMDLSAAERLLNRGDVDHAITALHGITAAEPKNGTAHLLLCRAFYAYEAVDEAVGECEAATETLRTSSALDWMGRAYGRKAEQYGPISGLAYARRVRDAFSAAVSANANDGEAVNDLSEFYINAPSMIGGGLDKAQSLASRSASSLPQNSHRIRAMAAEKANDYGTAEREFQAAAGVANQPNAWSDLGYFYARRKQYGRAVDALQHAVAADKAADSVLVDCADILIGLKLHPELSEQWLHAYLAGNAQSDDAPAFRARTELAKLLAARNDKGEARAELNRALAQASNYEPAKKALHSL